MQFESTELVVIGGGPAGMMCAYQAASRGVKTLLLESNDIHHVLLETGDAGAFYTGRDWTTQGNVLRGNFVHDIGGGIRVKLVRTATSLVLRVVPGGITVIFR